MKKLLAWLLFLLSVFLVITNCEKDTAKPTPEFGQFTDSRDGQTYKIVAYPAINQTWMAENLNFETADSWWFQNDEIFGEVYGRLYTLESAKKACPPGWKLPSDQEWMNLANHFGGYNDYPDGGEVRESEKSILGPG